MTKKILDVRSLSLNFNTSILLKSYNLICILYLQKVQKGISCKTGVSPICLKVIQFPLLPRATTEAGFLCFLPEILCVSTCIYIYLKQMELSSIHCWVPWFVFLFCSFVGLSGTDNFRISTFRTSTFFQALRGFLLFG